MVNGLELDVIWHFVVNKILRVGHIAKSLRRQDHF